MECAFFDCRLFSTSMFNVLQNPHLPEPWKRKYLNSGSVYQNAGKMAQHLAVPVSEFDVHFLLCDFATLWMCRKMTLPHYRPVARIVRYPNDYSSTVHGTGGWWLPVVDHSMNYELMYKNTSPESIGDTCYRDCVPRVNVLAAFVHIFIWIMTWHMLIWYTWYIFTKYLHS